MLTISAASVTGVPSSTTTFPDKNVGPRVSSGEGVVVVAGTFGLGVRVFVLLLPGVRPGPLPPGLVRAAKPMVRTTTRSGAAEMRQVMTHPTIAEIVCSIPQR